MKGTLMKALATIVAVVVVISCLLTFGSLMDKPYETTVVHGLGHR